MTVRNVPKPVPPLPVDKLVQIRSAECMACLECVAVCPAKDALVVAVTAPKVRRAIPAWSVAAGIAIVFFSLVGYAKLSGHWETSLPRQLYFRTRASCKRAAASNAVTVSLMCAVRRTHPGGTKRKDQTQRQDAFTNSFRLQCTASGFEQIVE